MNQPHVSCSGCARHVRASESHCPFCGVVVTATPRPDYTEGAQGVRLSRAAAIMLGASLAAGCHNPTAAVYGGPPPPMPTTDAAVVVLPTPPNPPSAPVYGAPPLLIDAGQVAPQVPRVQEPLAIPAYGAPPPMPPTPPTPPPPRRRR